VALSGSSEKVSARSPLPVRAPDTFLSGVSAVAATGRQHTFASAAALASSTVAGSKVADTSWPQRPVHDTTLS
jgi:hypothetical protein